jgi:hypothetical protein
VGKRYEGITDDLRQWIERQRIFFVATAPLAAHGLVNCSPKGLDSLRILSPTEVAYADLTGSGVETIAHLRENGRIVLMFCAFQGPPKIVRLHGTGTAVREGTDDFEQLRSLFPDYLGTRAIIRVSVARVSDSCGFAVPTYEFKAEREALTKWSEKKGAQGLADYRHQKNSASLDGLPGLD